MLCPTTPRAGGVGGFCVFVLKMPLRGWGFAISTLRYWANVCACIHAMCSFHHKMDAENTVLIRLQTSSGSRNRAVTFHGGKEELFCVT